MTRALHGLFFLFSACLFLWLLSIVDNRQVFLTSTPTSDNQGQHGLSQFKAWLIESGVDVKIVNDNYLQLPEQNNNLLVLSLPSSLPANQQELDRLATWVSKGNHLIALLAINDRPHWHNKQNLHSVDSFLNTFNLKLVQLDSNPSTNQAPSASTFLTTRLQHPLTRDLKRIQSASTLPRHSWQLLGAEIPQSALILLRDETSLSPVAWLALSGNGMLFLFSHSDLFANSQITGADNLIFAKNILNYAIDKSATVYFDDIHHLDATQFQSTGIIPYPMLILLFGVLCYSLLLWSIDRLTQKPPPANTTLENHLRERGEELTLTKNEIALEHAAHFFNDVRIRLGLLPSQQPVWDYLADKNINARLLKKAHRQYKQALAAKRINLYKFVRQLEKLRIELK